MALVTCSQQVEQALLALPTAIRESVELRLDYIADMPRMYPIRQDERFPGCRGFWVDPCFQVFYMVGAEGDDVHVVALIEEDVDATRPEGG